MCTQKKPMQVFELHRYVLLRTGFYVFTSVGINLFVMALRLLAYLPSVLQCTGFSLFFFFVFIINMSSELLRRIRIKEWHKKNEERPSQSVIELSRSDDGAEGCYWWSVLIQILNERWRSTLKKINFVFGPCFRSRCLIFYLGWCWWLASFEYLAEANTFDADKFIHIYHYQMQKKIK